MFDCSKEGKKNVSYRNKRGETKERKRGETRCNCPARMSVWKKNETWVVKHFVEKHNHLLATPRKVHFLRSHRGVSATKRALVQEYTEANIPTCKQVRLFEIDSGESFEGIRGALMKITRELIDDASLTEARSKFLMEKLKILKWERGHDKRKCLNPSIQLEVDPYRPDMSKVTNSGGNFMSEID
ncbi:FAR1-related sequence 5 [Striga asiatica]|uniref:FAR1-related sequence 5 n=1 Tax=Striga asiatica TaxID=4170 RepID=A0A5A7PAJ2_STRAF|nr:FAR1-related sequence 5 [Striga asiatica]